jgi:membrane associated rhomboid family serine protease
MIPLSDSHPAGKFPFWTIFIIVINVVVFFLQLSSPDAEAFIREYALIPANVNFSDFSTLFPFVTSQYLHGGFLHIISNMLFLWIFGDNVEGKMGYLLFPIFYTLFGIIGGISQYIFMTDSTIPMLGASGAVAGVLGAYFAWFPHHSVKTLVPVFGFFTLINVPASIMLLYWIVTQIFAGVFSVGFSSSDVGGVAYFAHIGGFAAGWIIAKIMGNNSNVLEPTLE